MFLTLLGVILALIPFIFIIFFEDKRKALLRFLAVFFTFHTLVAVLTQLTHTFTYFNVMTINFLMVLGLIFYFHKFNLFRGVKFNFKKEYIIPIVGIIIVTIQLAGVHFNYTGNVSTIKGKMQVENDTYTYPIYSDEWIAASLIQNSINNQMLPIINPLKDEEKPVTNFMLFHHSFFSELFLILNLDPVTDFAYAPILLGIFICFSAYLILRSSGLDIFPSTIVMLFIPHITNAANLPGLWHLMPYLSSLGLFILALSLVQMKENKWSILPFVLSFLFYPPMILFILSAVLVKFKSWKSIKVISTIGAVSVFCIFLILSIKYGFVDSFSRGLSLVFRDNMVDGVYGFYPRYIIPAFSYLFILLGIYQCYRDKRHTLLVPSLIGIVFWFSYSFTSNLFLMEHARIVIITSVLLLIVSGYGISWVWTRVKDCKPTNFIGWIIIMAFGASSFIYTSLNDWDKVYLHKNSGATLSANHPINRYINESDISLFKDIHKERFISNQWKGLTLGVAKENYPLHSKASTFRTKFVTYETFFRASCEEKGKILEKFNTKYVYNSSPMECEGFEELGVSSEGLVLYKYNLQN